MKYWPIVLLSVFLGRLVIFGSNLSDALIIIALASLYGFSLYLTSQEEEPINAAFKEQMEFLHKDVKEVQNGIAAIKIGATLRR